MAVSIMNIDAGLAFFYILLVLYGAVGVLIGRASITMPMVFMIIGLILGPSALNILPINIESETVIRLTELTLALLLFADASTLDFKRLRHDAGLPLRLLGIGLPLTIALGGLIYLFFFPNKGIGFAFLIASILAPTDAALGLPIFNNQSVPVRIRRALNVESGLNDGIATPFVTLFISLAVAEENAHLQVNWLATALTQIVLAVMVGTVAGSIGGKVLEAAHRRKWTEGPPLQFAVFGLALTSYFGSLAVGGNGFIAAFIGGIVFGAVTRNHLAECAEYTETSGTLLSLFVWAIFGALFVGQVVHYTFDWRVIALAVLSLTLVRMLPVAVAMLGKKFRGDTVALMGWFGPRGLASVIFGLLAFSELAEGSDAAALLATVVTWTILLSVLAHGLSAQTLASVYARRLKSAPADTPERVDVPEIEVRSDVLRSASRHTG